MSVPSVYGTRIPFIGAPLAPVRPSFNAGQVGGGGGIVTDGGVPGRVTFNLPVSGHADPSAGCWIAWPAVDPLQRSIPNVASPLVSASDVRANVPIGWAQLTTIAAPGSGNGVHVGVMVCAADLAANVTSTAAQGYGAELTYTGTPGVRASLIRSAGWATSGADSHPDIGRVRVEGDLLRNGVATGLSVAADVARGGRYIGAETIIGSGNQGDPVWLVAYAYRTGASPGPESVTVDVSAAVLPSGVTA